MTKSTVEVALRSTQPAEEIARGQTDSAGAEVPRLQKLDGLNPKGNEETNMTHFSKLTAFIAISAAASLSATGCYSEASAADENDNMAIADESVASVDENAVDESLAVTNDEATDDDATTSDDDSALSSWGGGYGGWGGWGGYRRGWGGWGGYRRGWGGWGGWGGYRRGWGGWGGWGW